MNSASSCTKIPNDVTPLTIGGALDGGSAVAITDALALSVQGSVRGEAVGLSGAAIDVGGSISGGTAVALAATRGAITAPGAISTPLLTGSAATGATFSGANTITTLGGFTAGGALTLADTVGLTVNGPVAAASVGLSAPDIALNGAVTGTALVSLSATAGGIVGGGTITTALLSGSASGGVSLTGPNAIASLGSFTAGDGFALVNQPDLTVAGPVSGGPSVAITDAAALTVTGSVTGGTVRLTASSISACFPGNSTNPLDRVGVYMHGTHPMVTGLFGATIGLSDHAVMDFEPLPTASCNGSGSTSTGGHS